MTYGKLAIVALLATGSLQTQAQWGTLKEISLERTPCFGACPIYKVTIKSDGTLIYHGQRFVDRIGDYRARVSPSAVKRLGLRLNRLGYWEFARSYDQQVTDLPSQIVTVRTNRFVKTVSEYGRIGPDNLKKLQDMIDGLMKSAKGWKKLPSPQEVGSG